MPIVERDPWRHQYFDGIACPDDVVVPTDDMAAWSLCPRHRWVYNKLLIAESQGLECAPHGVEPPAYPVFSKPIVNLQGMGVGSRVLRSAAEHAAHLSPGHFWSRILSGDHVSTDVAVDAGRVRWMRHAVGLPGPGGTFDYWTLEAPLRTPLAAHCRGWVETHLPDYSGMINLESIGEHIIEVHLRFADQWPDLYGAGWIDAVVGLYAGRGWRYDDAARTTGYSVALFGEHGRAHAQPSPTALAAVAELPGVSSVQVTFEAERPAQAHAMPPGGFRLAVVNAWDLQAGLRARRDLALAFARSAPAGERP